MTNPNFPPPSDPFNFSAFKSYAEYLLKLEEDKIKKTQEDRAKFLQDNFFNTIYKDEVQKKNGAS